MTSGESRVNEKVVARDAQHQDAVGSSSDHIHSGLDRWIGTLRLKIRKSDADG